MNTPGSLSRRDALKTLGAGAALVSLGGLMPGALAAESPALPAGTTKQPFVLPKLGYAYDALEPHFDARTMEIHHTKHHQAYIDNANKALADYPDLRKFSGEQLIRNIAALPEAVRTALRNNVGGHLNHSLFWQVLTPGGGGRPEGNLASSITQYFGSFDAFKNLFNDTALKRFGSGWVWLTAAEGAGLGVTSTPNQDSPISSEGVPLLGLDVWEHAYYLKYQNRRSEYIAAFWNVVNWPQVAANYARAAKG